MTAPVFRTEMLAPPAVVVVEIATHPPATLWRSALSARLATKARDGLRGRCSKRETLLSSLTDSVHFRTE